MIEQDTIKLLRECDAGVKMGISSIDDVLDDVKSVKLKEYLVNCKNEHVELATGMSWVKTNMKLAMKESDETIADLMTDGCNMGVKSLNKYLNEYCAADEVTKDICKRLINLEEKLTVDIRNFL